jgi:hypothetical protein
LPFPFSRLPSFIDLKLILINKYECAFKSDLVLVDHVKDSYPVTYFEREVEDSVYTFVVVFPEDEEEIVGPTLLRSICTGLKIPLEEFGLELGPSSWEE